MKPNIARHEPATCLAPGLFCSMKKGDRPKLNIKYRYNDTTTIEFRGADQLGADDLRVLQGLISLAGKEETGLIGLSPTPKTTEGEALRLALQTTGEAASRSAIMVRCSYKALFNEIGMSGGGAQIKSLEGCLKRLFAVSVFITEGKKWAGFHLLSTATGNDASLLVALNPAITTAITGGRFVKINMLEVRALKSDPARLIHQRLCSFIDSGNARSVSLDTLLGYVWADQSSNANTIKTRRQAVRKALTELQGLGWSVIEAAGQFRIGRP